MIRLIDNIDLVWKNNQPLGCCIHNRTWQKIALQQGDMDGACAVYSLMMYLIAIKVLTYAQVKNLNTKFNGQTSKGRSRNLLRKKAYVETVFIFPQLSKN